MSSRLEYSQQIVASGTVFNVTVLDHATIDDVVVAEANVYAVAKLSNTIDDTRRVDLGIRNYLIKLGVEI